MNKLISLISLLLILAQPLSAKLNYTGKAEIGYLRYNYKTVMVEPGPGWKGYNIPRDVNGINFNFINGINFRNRLYPGVGVGYLNFDGVSGVCAFADVEYLLLKTRFTPLVNLKVGYSHIWNQYDGGTGTGYTQLNGGVSYGITPKFRVYAQAGALMTQQVFFFPFNIGIRMN